MGAEQPIWTPSLFRIADANLTRFMARVAEVGVPVADCDALYRWSVDHPAAFWEALWDFSGVVGDRGTGPSLVDGSRMPGARWFADARLNFAENLLRGPDEEPAIVFRNERGQGPAFWITTLVAQFVLSFLATMIVMWFSRRREFRADHGGATLAGRQNMIAALESLGRGSQPLPEKMAAFGISGGRGEGLRRLFMSHPPLEERIAALQAQPAA